jgi:hypothetical protein
MEDLNLIELLVGMYVIITMLINLGTMIKAYDKYQDHNLQYLFACLVFLILSPLMIPLMIGATMEKINK